jgi:hypothetical protein
MEFTMPEHEVYDVVEKDDKIDLKELGKIGNALKAHFAKYPDLLIIDSPREKHLPRREDL